MFLKKILWSLPRLRQILTFNVEKYSCLETSKNYFVYRQNLSKLVGGIKTLEKNENYFFHYNMFYTNQ